MQQFFPDALFAWVFYLGLVGITLIASYTDVRRMVVPKWLTLPALGLGIVIHVIRGAWMGAIEDEGLWLGAWDGLLFSLGGFALSFALFFVMWVLGTCRGGDVKLFAATGAWLGYLLAIYVLAGTIVVVAIASVLRVIWRAVAGEDKTAPAKPRGERKPLTQKEYEEAKRLRRRMIYSPALALSTALLVLWKFQIELHVPLAPAKHQQTEQRG